MFLIQESSAIFAETGRGIGHSTAFFYHLCHWRDQYNGIIRKVTFGLALIVLTPISTIECVVRSLFFSDLESSILRLPSPIPLDEFQFFTPFVEHLFAHAQPTRL